MKAFCQSERYYKYGRCVEAWEISVFMFFIGRDEWFQFGWNPGPGIRDDRPAHLIKAFCVVVIQLLIECN